jgi:hypothetical protein
MMQNLTFTAPTSYMRIHSFIRLFSPEPPRYRVNFVFRAIESSHYTLYHGKITKTPSSKSSNPQEKVNLLMLHAKFFKTMENGWYPEVMTPRGLKSCTQARGF